MEDYRKRWTAYPEIGFDLNRILTVNKRIVELSDISGPTLADYVEIGREQIDSQLEVLNKMRRYRGGSEVSPHILVGRLAVSTFEDRALTDKGLRIKNDLDIKEGDLHKEYRVFWHTIDHALYEPVVHRNILKDYLGLHGTWLGLYKRP